MFIVIRRRAAWRLMCIAATCALTISGTSSCGSADRNSDAPVRATLILKTATNPFFVAMQTGAQERAAEKGIDLTVAAGQQDGDVDSQITAINAAVGRGDKAY